MSDAHGEGTVIDEHTNSLHIDNLKNKIQVSPKYFFQTFVSGGENKVKRQVEKAILLL